MGSCRLGISNVWECPACGRQTAVLEGERDGYQGRPYVCDCEGRLIEMEQRLPEAFDTARQYRTGEASDG